MLSGCIAAVVVRRKVHVKCTFVDAHPHTPEKPLALCSHHITIYQQFSPLPTSTTSIPTFQLRIFLYRFRRKKH